MQYEIVLAEDRLRNKNTYSCLASYLLLHTETDGYGHQENETKVYHRPQIFALKKEREIPNVAVLQPIVLRSIKFC